MKTISYFKVFYSWLSSVISLPTKFQFIWLSSYYREEDFEKSTNQKQELSVVAMFVYGSDLNEQSL
jgi:hypoxanthine-guanine phosphoribosyltransferase